MFGDYCTTTRRLYLWCKLPDSSDSAALEKFTMNEEIVLAAGNVFSPSLSKDN